MKRSKLLLYKRVFQSLTTTPIFYLVGDFFSKNLIHDFCLTIHSRRYFLLPAPLTPLPEHLLRGVGEFRLSAVAAGTENERCTTTLTVYIIQR
jgi:hypothetical protein